MFWWRLSISTCGSATEPVRRHLVLFRPSGVSRLALSWLELRLRQSCGRPSRWGRDVLLTYPELSCIQSCEDNGRQLGSHSGSCEGCKGPTPAAGQQQLSPPHHESTPHEAIGRANSQSPLCCEEAARNDAWCCAVCTLASTSALSSSTPGRSQNCCLAGKTSGISPNLVDQSDR